MNPNDTFPQEIVKELEARGAVPKPRWHFLVSRGMTWFLAAAPLFLGGLAFAVAEFVFFDNDGISRLQGSSFQDIAQTIPFVWLGILVLFSVVAYYGFRKTRGGYKYATTTVVLGVVFLSIVLGLTLNALDFGQGVHDYLLGPAQHGTVLPAGEGQD